MKTHRFASTTRSLLLFFACSMAVAFACSDDGSSVVGMGPSGGAGGTSSTGSNTSTASTGMTSGAGGSPGSGGLVDASAGSAGAPDASSGTGGARMDASVADQKGDVPVPV